MATDNPYAKYVQAQQAPAADPIIKQAPPPPTPAGYDRIPGGMTPIPGGPADPDAPGNRKTTYRTLTAEEAKTRGLPPGGVYQMSSEGSVSTVSAAPKDGDGVKAEYSQAALDAFDRALGSIKTLRDHPGRAAAVGSGLDPNSWGSYSPISGTAFGGTDAAGFEARLEALKAQTFLPMIQALKGMGALSNTEGEKVTASIGALDQKMPEDDFLKSLREIETELQRYKERGGGGNLVNNDAIRSGYQQRIGEGQSADQIGAWLKSQGHDVNIEQVKAAVEFRRTHPDIDTSRYLLNVGTAPPAAQQQQQPGQPKRLRYNPATGEIE